MATTVGWYVFVNKEKFVMLEGNPMFDTIGQKLRSGSGVRNVVPGLLE